MSTIMQLTEQMSDLLSELIMKDIDSGRKEEISEQIMSLADKIKTHKNAQDIAYVELWIQVENKEEWGEFSKNMGR
jgi:hypothetical protein